MNNVLTQWSQLLELLPSDLEGSAREHRAFLRARGVPDAATLLRLFLVYSTSPMSFRQTVAWAEAQDIAQLTDVSLIERMERSESWLLYLVGQMLETSRLVLSPCCDRVQLVDASSLCTPNGNLWRIHIAYNAQNQSFEQLYIHDSK